MNIESLPENLKIVECLPKENYVLLLKFSDGVSGEVDLSSLVGKGVFNLWNSIEEFEKVQIDPESGTVCWNDGIDLDPYVLRLKIVKK